MLIRELVVDAVFFASFCGIAHPLTRDASFSTAQTRLAPSPLEQESDLRCLSVREAVNFAKSTNLLGVILEATTLVSFSTVHLPLPPLSSQIEMLPVNFAAEEKCMS